MNFRGWWGDAVHPRTDPIKARLAAIMARRRHGVAALERRSPWLAERLSFYHAWRANPRAIGAILPSGRALGAAMVREIDPAAGPVLELGPGTGAFTRALLARGVSPGQLVLVERDPYLATRLRRDFPDIAVFDIDAADLQRYVLFPREPAAAAVCGLPLLNLPLRTRLRILRATFTQLRNDGACYLFTYGVRCPVPQRLLERLGLRARKIEVVFANVPPARVWKLTRRMTPCGRTREL
ncbi:MAG: methyltransferase [Pigmentiphaga sp.]|nr:methyltransferase [Pigmentiphaga sp.]